MQQRESWRRKYKKWRLGAGICASLSGKSLNVWPRLYIDAPCVRIPSYLSSLNCITVTVLSRYEVVSMGDHPCLA